MLNNIFRKTVYEKRWMILAWALGLFSMTFFTMIFYPYLKNSGFEEVVANAPKSLQNLLGDASNYKTVVGYVDQQIFALRLPMMSMIMAIIVFVGIGVGDEDRGTLETLLALPVSRTKAFWQKFAAGAALTGLASVGIFIAVVASFPIIHGSMNYWNLAQATFGCWLISLVFGSLAYALGAASGKRGLTIGVTSGLAFISYMVSSLAPAVDKLSVAQKFTPFYYYNVPGIAQHGLKASNLLVLGGGIAAMLLVSLLFFRNRDLVRD
jgi:ABC-2 type transport system permease protein